MRSVLLTTALALCGVVVALPVAADVLAEGEPSQGYLWQRVRRRDGSIDYRCRSVPGGRLHRPQVCEDAGAVRP